MFRHSTESLESNLWCFFNINFNTGILSIYTHPQHTCCHSQRAVISVAKYTCSCIFLREYQCWGIGKPGVVCSFHELQLWRRFKCVFVCLLSLYWMSPIRTARPTARPPSCTRRTSGSTRRGCRLLSSRVGVIVDTCVCLQSIKKNVRHKSKDYTDHVMKNDHTHNLTVF